MEKLVINGNKKLSGCLKLHGAKNSVLPILCATVLVKGVCVIHNCPDLTDVDVTVNILKHLGAGVYRYGDTIVVDSRNITSSNILQEYMSELRSSIIFLGALASRTGEACLYLPGGCDIGLRPIDLHLKGLKSLGYNVFTNGYDVCAVKENTVGTEIVLPFPSVGATENIILASVFVKGKTTIINSAKEPEIADLCDFLNKAGAKISGASTHTIEIIGVDSLHSVEHTVIPDRILASTMISACCACKGKIVLEGVNLSHLMPTKAVFGEMGCEFGSKDDRITVSVKRRISRVRLIETMAYPGFPTDCQAPVMAALSVAHGTSIVKENIFENRFRHVEQLNHFGADIAVNDRLAIINGVPELHCANAKCTDLRGGAAVVICALAAYGESEITDIKHIDRGYEKIENQLTKLGAEIKRV